MTRPISVTIDRIVLPPGEGGREAAFREALTQGLAARLDETASHAPASGNALADRTARAIAVRVGEARR